MQSGPTTDAISRVPPATWLPMTTGIILSKHLAEIAGRREVMVQAAIRHEEHLTARNFPIDNAADIQARLAHEVAAEFDDQLDAWKLALRAIDELASGGADRREVERLLAREIRDAEAAADVDDSRLDGGTAASRIASSTAFPARRNRVRA